MDKIIESLSKLIPYETLGVDKEIGEPLSVIILAIIIGSILYFAKKVREKINYCKSAYTELTPQFDHISIKKARQFYIETQYQNASPSKQEEPGFSHQYIARNKLIPFFINNVFTTKKNADRFYIILADSGMGKTTFMVNLYLKYYSAFSPKREFSLKLFRFSNPDTLNEIRAIDNQSAKKTILLLDALDEDKGILSNDPNVSDSQAFNNRVDEIIEATKRFSEVLITCRTQYFPGQESDPYELKVKRPDESGYYTFSKLYISPFNELEVKKYLRKKYGIIPFVNSRKKARATAIVSKSKHLVMRPMLLSYIDYLIEDNNVGIDTAQIYKTLVKKWLQREGEKRKGLGERKRFIEELTRLSQELAKEIYLKWKSEGKMYLSKEETKAIADRYNIELKSDEITGQSLLTCDGFINWKFSHKSIMEFFLAKELHENPSFFSQMSFTGMDMAKKFYYETYDPLTIIEITETLSPEKTISPTFITINAISTSEHIQNFTEKEKGDDYMVNHVGYVFPAAIQFCNALNREKGFHTKYDKFGNLVNENGKHIENLKDFKGYRIPTSEELKKLISNSPLAVKNDSKIYFTVDDDNLNLFKTFIQFNVSGEWYCEIGGYGVATPQLEGVNFPYSQDKTRLTESLTIDVRAMVAATGNYQFHLIFIP